MTTWQEQLSALKPSAAPPIPVEVLRGLPAGGVYLRTFGDVAVSEVVRVLYVISSRYLVCSTWVPGDGYRWTEEEARVMDQHGPPLRYPRLPGMVFAHTVESMSTPGDQLSGRLKSATRRRNVPPGIKVGSLFQAWDSSHRQGKGKARGLGVFVASEIRRSPLSEIDADEMRLEGLPGMEPGEFRLLLRQIGAVTREKNAWGQSNAGCWRIAFEAVP